MKPRRILVIAAAGLVLVIAGLAAAAVLIPEQRVARAVADRAETMLGEPVAIRGVGLSVFPTPGVRLSGLVVGPDSTALARVEEVTVRVRILPLFAGRVVIRSLDIARPEIAVRIDDAGRANFPVLAADTSAAETPGRDIAFAIHGIRVTDGAIRYRNLADGALVELEGWNQELSVEGALEQGELASLTLTGRLEIDDVSASLPGAVLPARDLAVRVVHDAALDLAADRLELRSLELAFDGVTLGGSGHVAGVNSGRPDVRLDLAADGLDAGRLMAWVPDSIQDRMVLPDGRRIGVRGGATFRAAISGTVAPDTLPAVDGLLTLGGVAVTAGEAALLEDVNGRVAFSLDSVVARFDGRALDEEFNAGVALRDPAAPVAVIAVSGRADLGRLVERGFAPDTLGLAGALRVDLRTQLPVDDPAGARAAGVIEASGITVAGLDPAVGVPTATVRFDGGRVRVHPLRVTLGPEDVPLDFDITADGWIPAAADSMAPPPTVAVLLEAGTLDLDALFGPSKEGGYPPLLFARLRDRPIDGRPAGEVARELGLGVPPLPPVHLRFEARIAELVRNALHYHELEALARVTPRAVTLERLRFGLMGGVVEASGRVEPVSTDSAGAPVETRLTGRFGLTNVGAGPFFDTLTPFQDHLAGHLDMAGDVAMTLDRVALPVRSSVEAGGRMAVSDGRLTNWAVTERVGERLGIAVFDTLRFRDWAGSFRIDGPRVSLDETGLQGVGLDARAAGWFDFGGSMDVRATAALSPELARRSGAIGRQLVAAAPGGVPVGLRIHGNVESPDVELDLTAARQMVAGRAREAAEAAAREAEAAARRAARQAEEAARQAAEDAAAEARDRAEREAAELADRAADEVAERLELPDSLRDLPADSLRQVLGDSAYALLPDSVKVRADSLQQALENAIRERLRRLLPGGGGGGGVD